MSPEHIYSNPNEFYEHRVVVDSNRAEAIRVLTVDQHDCRSWYDERRIRLTATLCKAVVRRRSDDFQPIVRQKLVPEFLENAATRYGICHEQEAMAKYEAMMQSISPGLQVQKTGLVVSTTHPWLSASPDAVVTHPQSLNGTSLLEVKCPYSCRNMSLAEAASKPSFFLY